MRLEANCKAVIWDSSVLVDIGENGENTSGLCVICASVVVVDGKAGVTSSVLERSRECRVDEREICHESSVRPIRCLRRPILLVLHALKGSL